MKPFLLAIISAFAFIPLRAEPPKPAALTVGTRVFLDATVRPLDAFTARITHSAGTATLPAWELSAAQQRSFGFDPAATAAERARRIEAARDAEAARQREARIVAAADAAVAAAAARATEREEQRARAERIAKADERARVKEHYDRNRGALLHWAAAQSEARDGLPDKWTTDEDRVILRQLFSSGYSVENLFNLYRIPQ
jgi:hypothetical protein